MPIKQDMPATIERSPAKAQRTWKKVHDNAVAQYGEGERSKQELYERAKQLGVPGRSKMDKKELARAIARKQ
jgi:hypothetical protein